MKTWTVRLPLSLMVMVAFWAHRVPAQEPVLIVPEIRYAPAHHPEMPPAFAARDRPAPSSHHIQRALNNHGLGCATDPFYPSCANLQYQLRFMFGSCRSFFGQECAPNQWCGKRP